MSFLYSKTKFNEYCFSEEYNMMKKMACLALLTSLVMTGCVAPHMSHQSGRAAVGGGIGAGVGKQVGGTVGAAVGAAAGAAIATKDKRIDSGSVIGAAAGAVIGDKTIGGTSGAVIGGAVGGALGQEYDDRNNRR